MSGALKKIGLVAQLTVSGFTRERGFWLTMFVACSTSGLGW